MENYDTHEDCMEDFDDYYDKKYYENRLGNDLYNYYIEELYGENFDEFNEK